MVMEHETYWVVVATLIPVLAIASVLELRVLFARIETHAAQKDLSPEAWYFMVQALVTGALLMTLPNVMSSLYDGDEPGAVVRAVVRMGITATSVMLAVGPAVEAFRTYRLANRVKPQPDTDEDED